VEIQPGAQINALNQSSFVAVVAPRVVQNGLVSVNGSVAYVAAEQADLTINNGLFDIAVSVGTTDGTGIFHNGVTTGPARVPETTPGGTIIDPDNQAIYAVAVPKNDAITMLVSGSLGYTPATGVSQRDGEIILSAGNDVAGTTILRNEDSTPNGNIEFGGVNLTNDLTAAATGDLTLVVGLNSSFSSQADVTLLADQQVSATILENGLLDVVGNFTASGSRTGTIDAAGTSVGEDITAGNVNFVVDNGGAVNVGGNFALSADATGGITSIGTGAATAGNVSLILAGTTSSFSSQNITLSADARQAMTQAGQPNISPMSGSSATAGSINLNLTGSDLSTGTLMLSASAAANQGQDMAGQDATAGDIDVSFSAGLYGITNLFVISDADSTGGGLATSGIINFLADNSDLNVTNAVSLSSSTNGATAADVGQLIGFTVRGGSMIDISGTFELDSSAQLGDMNDAQINAGDIALLIDNASLNIGSLSLDSGAQAQIFGRTSDADGDAGNISLRSINNGQFSSGSGTINASGLGGSSANGSNGRGGNIFVNADGGAITFSGSLFLNADGQGGTRGDAGGDLGLGIGGNVEFLLENNGTLAFARLNASSDIF